MIPRCSGGCGAVVTASGKWCGSCWPVQERKPADPIRHSHESNLPIRLKVLDAAFKLAFGTKDERDSAINMLQSSLNTLREGLSKDKE